MAPRDALRHEDAAIANHEPTVLWLAQRIQRVDRCEQRVAASEVILGTFTSGSAPYWSARLEHADLTARLDRARRELRDAAWGYGAQLRARGLWVALAGCSARCVADNALALTGLGPCRPRIPCVTDFVHWLTEGMTGRREHA